MAGEVGREALEDAVGTIDASLLFDRSEGEPRSTREGCMMIVTEFTLRQHHPAEDEPEDVHLDHNKVHAQHDHDQASEEAVAVLGGRSPGLLLGTCPRASPSTPSYGVPVCVYYE